MECDRVHRRIGRNSRGKSGSVGTDGWMLDGGMVGEREGGRESKGDGRVGTKEGGRDYSDDRIEGGREGGREREFVGENSRGGERRRGREK